MIAPIFEKVSVEFPDISFLKIDIDDNPEAAANSSIQSVPTFQFLSGQEMVGSFAGADENLLRDNIQTLQDS